MVRFQISVKYFHSITLSCPVLYIMFVDINFVEPSLFTVPK